MDEVGITLGLYREKCREVTIVDAAKYAVINVVLSTCCFSVDLWLSKCCNEGRGEIRRELAAVVLGRIREKRMAVRGED